MTFGPSSVFTKEILKSRESTLSRQGSTMMFSMPEIAAEVTSATHGQSSNGGHVTQAPTMAAVAGHDYRQEVGPSMSSDEATEQAGWYVDEFFCSRDLDQAEEYFVTLPMEHRHLLVHELVSRAVMSKEVDAELVADLFERVQTKSLASPTVFERGFTPTVEIIDDIALDEGPKSVSLLVATFEGSAPGRGPPHETLQQVREYWQACLPVLCARKQFACAPCVTEERPSWGMFGFAK
ncbi:hypothetical protein BV20DRAFT_422937 [Pilatotrama ljubarskyi]|nr:hypothetical protein BV20DRAFT_422937 [Pilatotrama ljubarskyi]